MEHMAAGVASLRIRSRSVCTNEGAGCVDIGCCCMMGKEAHNGPGHALIHTLINVDFVDCCVPQVAIICRVIELEVSGTIARIPPVV